jgi:hypothetical protein
MRPRCAATRKTRVFTTHVLEVESSQTISGGVLVVLGTFSGNIAGAARSLPLQEPGGMHGMITLDLCATTLGVNR